jgi:hypothetical protein
MESNPPSVSPHLLRRYFYSGWAFFMPYLFFYLLYYWRKWPVNPLPGCTLGSGGHVPALLHVYWTLHAINMILGFLALRAWHQRSRLSTLRPLDSRLSTLAFSLLPWLLLALIFYIPGAYLEWPSDPWEHLRRINEWHGCQAVGDHSTRVKSSYFLAYSLLGRAFGLQQLFWLDFYYTGICLLLCWQYYRLARAVGLGERASLVFVILQTILFGNNIFSFYRYYGISSSIYAQLGAIALTRLGLEFARQLPARPIRWRETLGCAALLVLFTAFNHGQGIGIAALGLVAVATWRLIAWKRSASWILLAAAILLSCATVRWYPRHPAIDQTYRPGGYLNAWYGFNIFSLSSPAGDRMMQIVGAIGLVNLAAGLLLLRHNHPAGWLTLMPVIALCLPCVAIPLAGALAQHGYEINIILFQRMLFAIPVGLAMVCLGSSIIECRAAKSPRASGRSLSIFALTIGSLVILTTAFPGGPRYNHFWHALAQTPDDLRMHDIIGAFKTRPTQPDGKELELVPTANVGPALQAIGIQSIMYVSRSIGAPIADSANGTIEALATPRYRGSLLYIPSAQELYTATSLAGQLSGHWPPQQVASDYAAGPELEVAARNESWTKLPEPGVTLYNWYLCPQKIEGVNRH